MTDDLTKALAELRRVTPPSSPWEAGDIGVGSSPVDYHIATTLNAALSGDLIPKADADLAVALMVEPLLKLREGIEADIRSAHHGRGNGSSSAMREDDRDFRAAVAAAFDALAPARFIAYAREAVPALSAERAALKTDVTTYQAMVMDLTAEGEALRAKLAEVTAERSSLSAMFATQAEETQAAKARVAELEALIRGKTFTVDESVELKAENERLRTPQGAAKVLLTISDVEIKPAAKALQDAFNLKGIGWKRYLSALRAAITALQETKP